MFFNPWLTMIPFIMYQNYLAFIKYYNASYNCNKNCIDKQNK